MCLSFCTCHSKLSPCLGRFAGVEDKCNSDGGCGVVRLDWWIVSAASGVICGDVDLPDALRYAGPVWLPSSRTGSAASCAAIGLLPHAPVQAGLQCWGPTITELFAVAFDLLGCGTCPLC